MNGAALFAILITTNLPVAHNYFIKAPSLPYIIYKESGASGRGSDEKNMIRKTEWMVELYTTKKEPETQELVEDLLNERGLEWNMAFDDMIDSEGLYMCAYAFETTGKIRRT